MSTPGRNFIISAVFTKVSEMKDPSFQTAKKENHYGIDCQLTIKRNDDYLGIYIRCYSNKSSEWKIGGKFTFQVVFANNDVFRQTTNYDFTEKKGMGFSKLMKWSKLYATLLANDDTLRVSCEVTLESVVGIYKEPATKFDHETMRALSDITFKVGNEQFYVSRFTLALHSSYFESMFVGGFSESNKSMIELKDVDPVDFQEYLELIFLGAEISDYNVERMLQLADMYDTSTIIKKCAVYLMKENADSSLSIKDKTRMGLEFNLKNVQEFCENQWELMESSNK